MRVIKYGKHGRYFLFDQAKGDGAGAAGGGGTGGAAGAGATPDPKDEKIAALEKTISELKLKGENKDEDPDLMSKARKESDANNKKDLDNKALESAVRFDLGSEKFLEENKTLLPKEVFEIFKQAKKETYGDSIEKSQALKSGIIQSFFSVQANVDLLTPGLKSSLDDYLKLTKNGKQEKAQQIYDTVFEPAFATLKAVKKAEALGKGHGEGGAAEDAYKTKMSAYSREYYLGKKGEK